MSADPLGLFDYLIEALYCVTPAERARSHWVMDDEWLNDIRRITDASGRTLWEPSLTVTHPDLLLGKPIKIRKGAGAPHLEESGWWGR